MNIKYYYDEQFRRTLLHIIRVFGSFEVRSGLDNNGNVKYRKVPCRYAGFSRQSMYLINGMSENIMQTAPIITVNVQSLKIDRKGQRAPASLSTIVGVNESPDVNSYTKKLDKIEHVERMNPIPWDLVFNINIWTTNLTNKMEIWEQIATLFDPAINLQLSNNPLDWTSLSTVELIDSSFSTAGFPEGTDTNLDVATMTFKTTIHFSLPAIVQKAKLIQQIVTNIQTGLDEVDLGANDIITDVYTPNNMCIKAERSVKTANTEEYILTLVNSSMNEVVNGNIYSWNTYFKYLDTDYDEKNTEIRFMQSIEDNNPVKGMVVEVGETGANKLRVQVDTSQLTVTNTIKSFITSPNELLQAEPNSEYVNINPTSIDFKGNIIKPNEIFSVQGDNITILDFPSSTEYIYCSADESYYRYNSSLGWHQMVFNQYRQGYWRIGFN